MAQFARSAPLVDPAELRFRVATVRTGCWLTLAVCALVGLYLAQTWGSGNRVAMLAIVIVVVLFDLVLMALVPFKRIVAGRWRELFFVAWSISIIVAVLVLSLLDPVQRSPLTLPLFMPLLFAGLSYPVRTAIAVSCMVVGGYLIVAVVQSTPLFDGLLVLSSLTWTACMCLWQAHNRNAAEAERKRLEAERERMELELRISQKLEAVGQLAAGIAHEINTPVQFIGDSAHFLRDAVQDLELLNQYYRELIDDADAALDGGLRQRARSAEDAADLAYLRERVPAAFARMIDGIERVASIVRAMKTFGRVSDDDHQAAADINEAIEMTLVVARNEYKYVAEVVTDLGELPPVICTIGDVSQVFLNLIVNAAHAIEDAQSESGELGRITITTRAGDGSAVISIADTGCGIAEELRARVFDPFFTTKDVGRGTGQGLSLARAIVERHHGSLTFDSEVGRGTTFTLTIPIAGRESQRASASDALQAPPPPQDLEAA